MLKKIKKYCKENILGIYIFLNSSGTKLLYNKSNFRFTILNLEYNLF